MISLNLLQKTKQSTATSMMGTKHATIMLKTDELNLELVNKTKDKQKNALNPRNACGAGPR